jgi:class 3 adenylate cyclase
MFKLKLHIQMGSVLSVMVLMIFNLCIPAAIFCQPDPTKKINKLFYDFYHTNNDSIKISKLSELAQFYNNYIYDMKIADSLSEIAVQIAERSHHDNLLLLAYNSYIESDNAGNKFYRQKALDYANKAIQLCSKIHNPRMEWQTCHNVVAANLGMYEYKNAINYSNRSMEIAKKLHDTALISLSYLDIAKSLEGENQKNHALANYLAAADLADKIGTREIRIEIYRELSSFFRLNKLYDRALLYKNKQKSLVIHGDSTAMMWILHDMQVIYYYSKKSLLTVKDIQGILDFAIRTKNNKLKDYEFALLHTYLINSNQIGELYTLYTNNYPSELEKMLKDDPAWYYYMKAFFKIVENQPDSATYFFRRAEKLMRDNPNEMIVSTFYNRFGQFLKQTGRKKEAIDKFLLSLEYASNSLYFGKKEYMLTSSIQLDSLYSEIGDYKKAYYFSKLNKELADSINILATKEQVITLSLNYDAKQKEDAYEQAAELEKQKSENTIRQRRTERNMMGGGIVFLLLLSYFIYRNYKNQKKSNRLLDTEKKKSDDLLLNILPFETAEELKHTGRAKAIKFDEVTVMFTDFKDFTLTSEKMSAEELVKLIHFYFSEFDRIISKHNIEKIKIIGDSYMCAGGLPVSNATHAFDVVTAALELQAFMKDQKEERILRNEPYFELRIGIHTGPVVAGIVGLKKFSYDIWGDTVNTASRMETTGETHKVNISGSTYERVKDRFACSYRGKVKAKNKGEIDMFFVISKDQDQPL